MTFQPFCAKSRAVAAPKPDVAPVMKMTGDMGKTLNGSGLERRSVSLAPS
jgi:hypothetical protein